MGNGGPGAPVQRALELWVLGWHMAAVVALGVPRLVPIVVFTGLGPREAVASWDLERRSSVPPAEGWHEPPWLLGAPGAHTMHKAAWQKQVQTAGPGHANGPSSLGGRPAEGGL